MRRTPFLSLLCSTPRTSKYSTNSSPSPIVAIQNGTFYRQHPTSNTVESTSNPPIFPGLNFSLSSQPSNKECWAIVGSSNAGKSTFLELLLGKHLCLPPTARSFPYLSSDEVDRRYRNVYRAIQYIGFDAERGGIGNRGTRGAYMSARYESRRESTDFSVLEYLRGDTELNPAENHDAFSVDDKNLKGIVDSLQLGELLSSPTGNLSNGQTRRARIAKALLGKPLVLLLDEPFMGLDPPTRESLSRLLNRLAEAASPRLVLALRPQDPVPSWITHMVLLGPSLQVSYQGEKARSPKSVAYQKPEAASDGFQKNWTALPGVPVVLRSGRGRDKDFVRTRNMSHDGIMKASKPQRDAPLNAVKESIVVMENVHVKYGQKEVLGNWEIKSHGRPAQKGLWWDIRRGERWGVFGPNGSGKTTLISLICSDHPLSYSLPIEIFGRGRLPQRGEPGISIFDIQARIGQSSPEIHAFFPRDISLRKVIENAWADTFLGFPKLTYENDLAVDACLRWFEAELNPTFNPDTTELGKDSAGKLCIVPRDTDWADDLRFGDCPFSAQRVALFLRAIVKKPEMIILDEPFSGMDAYVRDKCMLFLTKGETHTFGSLENDLETKLVVNIKSNLFGEPIFDGLHDDQTLICVSHVMEEVPGLLDHWLCLPEAGTGKPARFGTFDKTIGKSRQWNSIWSS